MMRSVLVFSTVCAAVIASVLTSSAVSQQMAYPSWAASPSNGGVATGGYDLPAAYSGMWPTQAKSFFSARSKTIFGDEFTIQSSPTSGVLAIRDKRSNPVTKIGFDVGVDAVFSVVPVSDIGQLPAYFLVSGWDASTGMSKLLSLVVPPSGPLVVTDFGPMGVTGEMWINGSMVDGRLYLLDIQSHVIIRYEDSDGDGEPDARDASFAVPLPLVPTPGDDVSAVAANLAPFRSFCGSDTGVIGFAGVRMRLSVNVFIEQQGSGFGLAWQAIGGQTLVALAIQGNIYNGQDRVAVVGPSGINFKVTRSDGSGSDIDISGVALMPKSGHLIVDLTTPLVGGWEVGASYAASSSGIQRPKREVDARDIAVLFPLFDQSANQGELVRFAADKMRASYKAMYRLDGQVQSLATSYVDENKIDILMPTIGDPTARPPFDHGRMVELWLVDEQAANTAITDAVYVWVFFD